MKTKNMTFQNAQNAIKAILRGSSQSSGLPQVTRKISYKQSKFMAKRTRKRKTKGNNKGQSRKK